MQLRSGLYPKTTLQTEPGEWLRMDTHMGPMMAWVVAVAQPRGREMMFFDLTGAERPRYIVWTGDTFCLSFGDQCVIEPVGFTEAYATPDYANIPGVLSVRANGSFLAAIDTRSDWRDVVAFNIETGAPRQEFGEHEGLFRQWKLWASDAARSSRGEMPLLEFSIALPARP